MRSVFTWDFAMRLANAEAARTGVRQRVHKSRRGGSWLVSPIVAPRPSYGSPIEYEPSDLL